MQSRNRSVQRQVILPWGQVVRIAYNSMRVRLFRSLITTLSLALAIAFVAYIRAGCKMLNAVWPWADDALRQSILSMGYEMSDGVFGNTPKDVWLVTLSLLVCVVGIVNAQLMSVSERFREIGTYKCLGALDSFVVRIFVLEAMYQGLLGGLAGSAAGVLTATAALWIRTGWLVILHWPAIEMLQTIALSSLLAVFLSFLGVLYPALTAARMQPAIALRRED